MFVASSLTSTPAASQLYQTQTYERRLVEEGRGEVYGYERGPKASALQSFASLKEFSAKYPASTTQLLASEDKAFFLPISQRCGQKSVPFIPILDASFEVWIKRHIYSCRFLSFCSDILLFRTLFGKRKTSRLFRSGSRTYLYSPGPCGCQAVEDQGRAN